MKYVKTEKGQQVLKDRSVPLTPRQRSAFIMCDGRNSVDQILAATASAGISREDIELLLALGLVQEAPEGAPSNAGGTQQAGTAQPAVPQRANQSGDQAGFMAPTATTAAPSTAPERTPQDRYRDAYPIAVKLAAGLGLRGFRLNLAVEAATSFEQLRELAPKLRDAVGPEKYAALDAALNG